MVANLVQEMVSLTVSMKENLMGLKRETDLVQMKANSSDLLTVAHLVVSLADLTEYLKEDQRGSMKEYQ